MQCALVLQHPAHAESLGRAIGEWTRELTPTVVLSPALGGVVIGQEVGRALGVRAIFAERQDGVFTLRRGFAVERARTRARGRRRAHDRRIHARDHRCRDEAGALVVGAASIVDRSGGRLRFDVPFKALLEHVLPTYEPEQCPLCAQGLAVIKPGSRPIA